MQTLEGHLARNSRHDDRRGNLPEPRRLRPKGCRKWRRGDLANMGPPASSSFTIRDNPRHPRGYLGRPSAKTAHRAKSNADAIIAQAEGRPRDSQIRSAQAKQAGQEAQFAADSKIAEAQR